MTNAKTQPNLEDETVAELRAQAKDAGISGSSHMRKDELISELEHKDTNGAARKTDAVALLKKDHANVKALFKKALAKEDGDTSLADIANQIITELELHTEAEEKLFYPALKQKALSKKNDDAKDGVLEAYVEHDSVKKLIKQIQSSKPSDESYKALIQVMSEQVEHHVEEEETEMFKQAKALLSQDEIDELGGRILEMKERLATGR